MIVTRELVSFTEGVKPALLLKGDFYSAPTLATRSNLKPRKVHPPTQHLLQRGYPHVKNILRGMYLFFQTEEMKQDFLDNSTVISSYRGEGYLDYNMDKIGLILGYPPIAVDYVISTSNDPRNNPRTLIDYYGIKFVCKPSDVDACIEWCKSTYTLTPELQKWNNAVTIEGQPYNLWKQNLV